MRKNGAGVGAGAGHPLPAVLVAGQVAVAQPVHEVPGALLPRDVQVLDQEARDDHPCPVVHPALGEQLAHAGVDHRETGAPLLPGHEPLARRVDLHPGEVVAQRLPRALGVVPQDVGVEVAPAQLRAVPVGGLALVPREVGQQRARVDLAVLEVRRHRRRPLAPPAGRGPRGSPPAAPPRTPASARGPPARRPPAAPRRPSRPGRARRASAPSRCRRPRRRRGRRSPGRPREPVRQPGPVERAEHLERRAGPAAQGARADRVGGAGGHQLPAVGGQRGRDRGVAPAAVDARVRGDVHLGGPHLRGQRRDDLRGVPVPDDEARRPMRSSSERRERSSHARRGGPAGSHNAGSNTKSGTTPSPRAASTAASSAGWSLRRRSRRNHSTVTTQPDRSPRGRRTRGERQWSRAGGGPMDAGRTQGAAGADGGP